MRSVVWSRMAVEDLLTKVKTQRVMHELRRLAEQILDDHTPPDGGTIESHGTVFWRRALTTERAAELDAAAMRGEDLDEDQEEAHHFRFIYHRRGEGRPDDYRVIAVLSEGELVEAFNDYLAEDD